MNTAIKNIVFLLVIWVYIFGSSGFTVHHCCCKKHYHVTCAVVDAWNHYVFLECEKHKHNKVAETADELPAGIFVVKPAKKHCADILFTMEATQYGNEDRLEIPVNYTELLFQYLPIDSNSIANNQYFGDNIGFLRNYDTSHYRYRQWCTTPDFLCAFII